MKILSEKTMTQKMKGKSAKKIKRKVIRVDGQQLLSQARATPLERMRDIFSRK